jgi:Bardet-Biedl syndrome 9 protein
MDGGRPLENLILASSTANLLVYKETQLVWCASCDDVPIALRVGEFGGLRGAVVSLSDEGALAVSYLGTSPPLNVASGHEGKELDYVAMDEEHRQLLSAIRSATGSVRSEPKERLQLRAQVPTVLDQHSSSWAADENAFSVTVRVYVNFIGTGSANDIAIAVSSPSFRQKRERGI